MFRLVLTVRLWHPLVEWCYSKGEGTSQVVGVTVRAEGRIKLNPQTIPI